MRLLLCVCHAAPPNHAQEDLSDSGTPRWPNNKDTVRLPPLMPGLAWAVLAVPRGLRGPWRCAWQSPGLYCEMLGLGWGPGPACHWGLQGGRPRARSALGLRSLGSHSLFVSSRLVCGHVLSFGASLLGLLSFGGPVPAGLLCCIIFL